MLSNQNPYEFNLVYIDPITQGTHQIHHKNPCTEHLGLIRTRLTFTTITCMQIQAQVEHFIWNFAMTTVWV